MKLPQLAKTDKFKTIMKKVLFLIAAAGLLLASCAEEDFGGATGQEVNVTFKAQIPDQIATKTYSLGENVSVLKYAVYDSNSKNLVYSKEDVKVENGVAVIDDLVLITGKTYDLLFWAQSPKTQAYAVSLTDQTLKVDYDKIFANDDNNDAFYAFRTFKINGALNETIELYRPFAQVNLGTDDIGASQDKTFALENTSLKTRVANVLNFVDGTVTGEADVTYKAAAYPATEAFPVEGYGYLSMNYLLVGESQTTTNCEFEVYEAGKTTPTNTISVANVPIKRNYRTNIYGSLLTDPASLKIVIVPSFEKEDYAVVDGVEAFTKRIAEINANTESEEFTIDLASDVEWNTAGAGDNAAAMFTNPDVTVTINGNGHKFTATGQGGIISNAKVIFNDVTFVDNTAYLSENGEVAWEFCHLEFGVRQKGDFTFNNCVFENTVQFDSQNATAVDCVFKGKSTNEANTGNEYAVWVKSLNSSFTGCTFANLSRGVKVCKRYDEKAQTMTIDGCTFENLSKKPGVAIDCVEGSVISIKNSTFTNVQPGDQKLYIYETDNVVPVLENNKVVKSALTIDDVNAAIKSGVYNVTVVTAPEADGTILLPAVPAGEEVTVTLPATEYEITFAYESQDYPVEVVNINAASSENLVINLPQSHVTLNGQDYGTVTATVSPATLVVAGGAVVETLNLLAGNAEIYGTVGTITLEKGAAVKVYDIKTAEDAANAVACNAGKLLISSADALKVLASVTNAGTSFAKMNIVLANDIDLAGEEWTPIGTSNNPFSGIFDGNGKTVSNLKISGNNSSVGLFGKTTNGEVKNLTVENAAVSGYLEVGAVAGNPYTSKYTNVKLTGLVKVDGYAYVGGVGGKNVYAPWTDITVDVEDGSYVRAQSENYRTYVGGVAGFVAEGKKTLANITSNIDVIGSTIDVGGLFGIAHYGNSFVNCSCSGNVEVENASDQIGGIAGVWMNHTSGDVTFDGCSFTGTLKAPEGVDLSDNTIVGSKYYSNSADGKLTIDGMTYIDGIAYDDKNYVISNANGLRWFAAQVNNKTKLQNKNVKLSADIDLAGQDWTPINGWDGVLNGTVIDGYGYTISNMTVDGGTECGFISSNASSVTIRNLKFDNAVVKAQEGDGTYAGVVIGKNYSSVSLEDVHVTNSAVKNNWQSGGFVGFAEGNAPVFKGCSISDSFVGGSNCTSGAFFGCGVVSVSFTECIATNVNLYTDVKAGFVGYLYGNASTETDCKSTNVVVVSEYPAGL